MRKVFKYFPLAALLIVIAIDAGVALGKTLAPNIATLREVVLVMGFLMLVSWLRNFRWMTEKTILAKLRILFFTFIILFLVILVSDVLFSPEIHSGRYGIYSSFSNYIYCLLVAIIGGALATIILMSLRYLIFAKRKKYTARNFDLMLVFMVAQILYANVGHLYTRDVPPGFGGRDMIGTIIIAIMITLIVINSFRNAWINYLNKKQKLATFWSAFFLVPMAIILALKLQDLRIIYAFSPSLSGLLVITAIFFAVYLTLAFFAVLLHLPTAGIYDRKIREVTSLHELSHTVSSVLNKDELVETITRLTCKGVGANYSFLLLIDPVDGELKLASTHGMIVRDPELAIKKFKTEWARDVLENKTLFLANEVQRDRTLKKALSEIAVVGSLLAVPLVFSDEVKGVLVAARQEEFGFEQDDSIMLQAFANQAASALQNTQLIQEVIDKELFEQELKIAHDAQMKLLPKVMPRLDGFEIDAITITANEVGGDYFDFFDLKNGKLGVAIGDVSGKGPSAAFYMAELKGIMASFAQTIMSPRELLIKTNQVLYHHIDRKTFISMSYAVIDVAGSSVVFARAGHCPTLLVHNKKENWEYVEPPGIGLGLDSGLIFSKTLKEKKISLKKGDVMLFFTDGVTEARNLKEEEFQEQRLGRNLAELRHLSAAEIKNELVANIKSFVSMAKPHDDLTFVLIKKVG